MYSTHVLSEDTLSRHVDAEGRLVSVRMLVKTNPLPKVCLKNTYTFSNKIVDFYVGIHCCSVCLTINIWKINIQLHVNALLGPHIEDMMGL